MELMDAKHLNLVEMLLTCMMRAFDEETLKVRFESRRIQKSIRFESITEVSSWVKSGKMLQFIFNC